MELALTLEGKEELWRSLSCLEKTAGSELSIISPSVQQLIEGQNGRPHQDPLGKLAEDTSILLQKVSDGVGSADELRMKLEHLRIALARLRRTAEEDANTHELVEFNVRGTIFAATLGVLKTGNIARLIGLESHGSSAPVPRRDGGVVVDAQERPYIDRDPDMFEYVLRFLNTRSLKAITHPGVVKRLLKEADYFELHDMKQALAMHCLSVLKHNEFIQADLRGLRLGGTDWSNGTLQRCLVAGTDFSACNFRGASCKQQDFAYATLNHCDFTGADLSGASFSLAIGVETCNFRGANLSATTLPRGGDLVETVLDTADMSDAAVRGTALPPCTALVGRTDAHGWHVHALESGLVLQRLHIPINWDVLAVGGAIQPTPTHDPSNAAPRASSSTPVPGGFAATTDALQKRRACYSLATGRLLREFIPEVEVGSILGIAGAGQHVCRCAADPHIVRIISSDGENIGQLRGHTHFVAAASVSPDGKLVATGGNAQDRLRVWDLQRMTCVELLDSAEYPELPCSHLQLTQHQVVATFDYGALVQVWDRERSSVFSSIVPTAKVNAAACDDGSGLGFSLALAHNDHTVSLYDTRSGKLLRTLKASGPAATCGNALTWISVRDGRVTAGNRACVVQWDASTGHMLHHRRGYYGVFPVP